MATVLHSQSKSRMSLYLSVMTSSMKCPPGLRCIKVTIYGKLDFNGNFHRILDADWLWCLVAMVVTIESKVTINGEFYATGALVSGN